MDIQQLALLIKKYNNGECTPEEKLWLEQWYLSFEWSDHSDLPESVVSGVRDAAWHDLQKTRLKKTAAENRPFPAPAKQPGKPWGYVVAAATVVSVCLLVVFYRPAKENPRLEANNIIEKPIQKDIQPGTRKASLTLANGSVISLDSMAVTQLKEEDGTVIDKQHGKIVYSDDPGNNDKVLYNTLSTPRGAEFELELPDGSKVWLNAASTLKFPTRFTEKERTVYLAGEAYFDISKNTAQPFRVITAENMEVEVTGTEFNVMAYNDEESAKTTLIEGRVDIRNGNSITALRPMQQASLKKNTPLPQVKKVDVEKEIAWMKGMIEFNDDNLPYIMRQLSRWYDVEVSFEGNIPEGSYNGSIPRKATLSEVMQILKLAGVKYRMNNRTVIIKEE